MGPDLAGASSPEFILPKRTFSGERVSAAPAGLRARGATALGHGSIGTSDETNFHADPPGER